MQPMQPQTIVLNTQPRTRDKTKFHAKCVRGLSITQITLGSIAFVLQIWDIINGSVLATVGHGIWTGIIFIIAGSLGVVSSQKNSTGWIVAFLVMSILASIITVGLLTPSAISLATYSEPYHGYPTMWGMTIAISAILVFIAVLEMIIAIVSSCYACNALCCSDTQPGAVVVQGTMQYVQGTNGQAQFVIVPVGSGPSPVALSMGPQVQMAGTSGGVFQTQPLNIPTGAMAQYQGIQQQQMMPGIQQVQPLGANQQQLQQPTYHGQQPVQPPSYQGNITPPPAYVPECKQ